MVKDLCNRNNHIYKKPCLSFMESAGAEGLHKGYGLGLNPSCDKNLCGLTILTGF